MLILLGIVAWCFILGYAHKHPIRGISWGERGGGGGSKTTTQIYTPTPAPQPSTADAINAYLAGLPQMYQAQMEWGPKLAQSDVQAQLNTIPQLTEMITSLQNQYSPSLAASQWALQEQYAPLMAAQQQQLQQQYEPGAYNALQNLGAQMTPGYLGGEGIQGSPLLNQMSNMMTPEYLTGHSAQEAPGMQAARERLSQQARSAWTDRGLAQSGMSAEDEARMLSEFELPYAMQQEALTQQVQAQRQGFAGSLAQQQLGQQRDYYDELGRRQNIGLSLAGRYNVPTQSQVQAPGVQTPSYTPQSVMSGYNFPNIANYMQQGYGSYTQAARPIASQNSRPGNAPLWGLAGTY